MAYDPSKHLIRVQGNREYLPVAQRLVWFREEHPDWGIETEIVHLDWQEKRAVCKATIRDPAGRVIAQGFKQEDERGFHDFLEKASTGSIGRALALCGYGTQWAAELDEGEARPVDSPQPLGQPAGGQPAGRVAGRPEGCSCPPACKQHQAGNPNCTLNAKS